MKWFKPTVAILVFLGIGAVVAYLWFQQQMTSPVSGDKKAIDVLVRPGMTFDKAVAVLSYHGLVERPTLFKLRARQRSRRVELQAGRYRFHMRMSPDEIMDKLASGPDVLFKDVPVKFRLRPGENIFQAQAKLRSMGAVGDLAEIANDHILVQNLGAPLPSRMPDHAHTYLEGYLFPDTYYLDREDPTVDDLVRKAVSRFKTVWNETRGKHERTYARVRSEWGLSDHEMVILASIVQKEIVHADEAPMVAGVFYNRLKSGQRLETDPTLVYGPDTWQEKPSPQFRRDKSNRYNTYRHNGLPPGPICNPGRAALEAVVAPSRHKWLYICGKLDGSGRHAFAKTLAEHKANIARYLRKNR